MRLLHINGEYENFVNIDKIIRFQINEYKIDDKRVYSVDIVDTTCFIQQIKMNIDNKKEAREYIEKILATIETTKNEIIYI